MSIREHLEGKSKAELVKMARDFNHLFHIKNAQKLLKSRLIDEFMRFEKLLEPHIKKNNIVKSVRGSVGYTKKREVKAKKSDEVNKLIKKQIELMNRAMSSGPDPGTEGDKKPKFENKARLLKEADLIAKKIKEMTKETREEKKIREMKTDLSKTPAGQKILKKMNKEEKKARKEAKAAKEAKKKDKSGPKMRIKKQIAAEKEVLTELKGFIKEFVKGKISKELENRVKQSYGQNTQETRNLLKKKYIQLEMKTKDKINKLKTKYNEL